MNLLHLTSFGVKLRVRNLATRSELEVREGRDGIIKPYITSFYRPRRFPYTSIIVDGHSGYISLQALHLLSRNKGPVFVMNFDGNMISSILPPMPVKADLPAAQLEASHTSVNYEETDLKTHQAFEAIKQYVLDGGIFVNVAGFAFYYAWDVNTGKKQPVFLEHLFIPKKLHLGNSSQIVQMTLQEIFPLASSLLWSTFDCTTSLDKGETREPVTVKV